MPALLLMLLLMLMTLLLLLLLLLLLALRGLWLGYEGPVHVPVIPLRAVHKHIGILLEVVPVVHESGWTVCVKVCLE